MSKDSYSEMTPAPCNVGKKTGEQPERRTRKAKKEGTKKRYELDEDLNDIKVVQKFKSKGTTNSKVVDMKSHSSDNSAKEHIDLSKYKDEYKHLIQSVKKDVPGKAPNVESNTMKSTCKPLDMKVKNKQTAEGIKELSKDACVKQSSSMDAFQLMMEARKKSIGMNSPGKELVEDKEVNDITEQKDLKAKRFLRLSMMADKKGANKRRELEELREENTKHALEKRADSFKKMLQKGNKGKSKKTTPEKLKEGIKDYEDIFVTKVFKKRQRDSSSKCESDNVPVKKSKIQSDSKLNICNNTEKNETIPVDDKTTAKKLNSSLLSEEEENFLKKLSPSLKKSESVLCYFGKTVTEMEARKSSVSSDTVQVEEQSSVIKVKCTPKNKDRKVNVDKRKLKSTKSKTKQNANDIKVKSVEADIPETKHIIKTSTVDNIGCDLGTEEITNIVSTPPKENQRPRRSIRKPVKYMQESSEEYDSNESDDDDMFEINKDCKKTKRKTTNKENILTIDIDDKVSPLKIINLQSPGQLKCIKSPKLSNDSLAPLFRKKLPKPKVDPSVMEARRLFLQSGVPETMKKHLEKSSNNISQDVDEFVIVHHILQQSDDNPVWNLPSTKYTPNMSELLLDVSSSVDISRNKDETTLIISKDNIIIPAANTVELFNKLNSYELKQGLRKLKNINQNFPVYKTFKQLWEKFTSSQTSSKISLQDSEGFVEDVTNTTSDVNNINSCMWTEKYKPLSSHDIIGNFTAISSIKRWLESWKEYNEMSASKPAKRVRRDSSSSDDFDLSDSESRDSCPKSLCNVMVITGPPGSGKTSSVYAISNELGINVLEVNASSRRTGKKIISDMHEATQSHKVLTKQNSEQNFSGFFSKSETNNEPKLLKKKKDKEKSECDSGILDSQKSNEANVMSLMLIDDADVVFEEDDGFVGALSQLVQSSKRPLLLVASDEHCSHLQRFKSDSNVIKFTPLSGKILGPWLDILLLIESNKIIPRLSANLLESNKGDMRKCILQLQYWISGSKTVTSDSLTSSPFCLSEGISEEDSNSSECNNIKSNVESIYKIKKTLLSESSLNCNLARVWWNIDSLLKEKSTDSNNTCGENVVKVINNKNHNELENLSKYIDAYSAIDLMQSRSKLSSASSGFVFPPWQRNLKDSLSESENMAVYDSHAEVSNAWCQYIQEHSTIHVQDIFGEAACQDDITHIETLDIRAQERRLRIYDDFSQGVSFGPQLDRHSMSMDYMATLRCICRSEKSRSSSNLKRNNRFHNYLNTLNISSNESTLNNACKIFVD